MASGEFDDGIAAPGELLGEVARAAVGNDAREFGTDAEAAFQRDADEVAGGVAGGVSDDEVPVV
jgi:hypothetical protein